MMALVTTGKNFWNKKEIQEKYDIVHEENKTGVQQYEFHRWHIIYSIHM